MSQVLADGPGIITSFSGEHWFLSSFFEGAPFGVPYWPGLVIKAREHFFQAAKGATMDQVRWVLDAPTPGEAKARGRSLQRPWNWDQRKRAVMLKGVLAQFGQHDPMLSLLAATRPKILVEGNDWGDDYWGAVKIGTMAEIAGRMTWHGGWCGQNWLGRILMMAREVLT